MKKLLLLCAGLALFASVISVMLWRDLRAERDLNAGLQMRLAEAEARAARPVPVAAARPAMATVAAGTRPETTSTATAPAAPAQPPAVINAVLNQREMLKDPEYRKARLSMMRMQLPEQYPDLAEELGLSPEQAGRLFDLLAENQLEMSSNAIIAGPNGQIDQAQVQEMSRIQQELRTRQESALTSLLGDARYGKWQEYQQTQSARQRVTQLGRSMDAMGLPLTSAQKKPLTELMVAEQARQRQEQQAMARELRPTPGQPFDPQAQSRLREENLKRQAESNRRVLDAAAAYLNPRQLELFRESVEGQLAMNRAASRMQSGF